MWSRSGENCERNFIPLVLMRRMITFNVLKTLMGRVCMIIVSPLRLQNCQNHFQQKSLLQLCTRGWM